MTGKTRIWIGGTLLIVLIINYAFIGFPLHNKAASLKNKYRTLINAQLKSGKMFQDSDSDYIMEVFRREKGAIDKKMLVLNAVTVSVFILIMSWTAFGLLFHRKQ